MIVKSKVMRIIFYIIILLFFVFLYVDSNLVIMLIMFVILFMGCWNCLFYLVGVVLGDFFDVVVVMLNKFGVEKLRYFIVIIMRLISVLIKMMF